MLKKFPTIREDKYLWKGQPSFELYDQMQPPKEGEYRVVKHKYDAFFETDLDSILRNNRIKTIIIVGTATNVCCEFTARSGFSGTIRSLSRVIATPRLTMECTKLRSRRSICSLGGL